MTPDPIATAILAAIEEQETTRAAVAAEAGVHVGKFYDWLAGKKSATTETASKVMAVLGLEVVAPKRRRRAAS